VSIFVPVNCSIGQYYDVETENCHPCAIGDYSDVEKQLQCKPCGEGATTNMKGSYEKSQCYSKSFSV